ncbi:hypothetical protein LLG07_05510 [bacterium]|nr:hypothetical protein [bacterium]
MQKIRATGKIFFPEFFNLENEAKILTGKSSNMESSCIIGIEESGGYNTPD